MKMVREGVAVCDVDKNGRDIIELTGLNLCPIQKFGSGSEIPLPEKPKRTIVTMPQSNARPIGELNDENIYNFFDRVAVVTLRSRTDRLDRLRKEMADMPWPFKEMSPLVNIHGDEVGKPPEGWNQGGGAWGCLCSHREILYNAIRDGVNTLLVLEDDCTFKPGLKELFRRFIADVPSDWEQIMLGGQWFHNEGQRREISPNVSQVTQCERTHCYALSWTGMRSLWLRWNKVGLDGHCDWVMGDWQDEGHTCYIPAKTAFMAGQYESASSILGKEVHTRFWDNTQRDSLAEYEFNQRQAVMGKGNNWLMPPKEILDEAYGKDTKHFVHSGSYGDIIYAMPVIKAMGGGCLWLDDFPSQVDLRITPQSVENIAPLLRLQPYIRSVMFCNGRPKNFEIDLNAWRWNEKASNNCTAYLKLWGQPLEAADEPWLTVQPKRVAPIVINRTPRYPNGNFPWQMLIEAVRGRALFIGLDKEYESFVSEFGDIPRYCCANLLEAAQAIAGADLYIGNQSSCRAIAEGLKKPVIQEVHPPIPNCNFGRPNEIDYWSPLDHSKIFDHPIVRGE
jgi:hypothetical protein